MHLIASDVDGTLVPRLGPMSDRTVAALATARDAGVHVVLATGRPPRWMGGIVERAGLRGRAVLANGALVVDLHRLDEPDAGVVRARTIRGVDVRDMTDAVRRALPGASFAVETARGFGVEPGWPSPVEADLPRASLDDLLREAGDDVIKLLVKTAEPERPGLADAMLATVGDLVAGRAEATHSGDHLPLVELGPPGVDKAAALAEVAAELGVAAADTVAFGDMPNDVAMLRWAGAGYAMADGHPVAREAADHLAPPCAEDGVAQVLERLLEDPDGRAVA
ncbi:HAD family hydrolase [Aquipuribacter nitratireducens]|uniref:HAD family hydrolase n=1 Tax=Aquipuribacter nitratireducens TaxID=650104 RepID=A0ABW0GS71_9MICO